MKKYISFISCLSIGMLAASVSLSSCMSDSLNLDPDKIQESELNKDNLWGTYLTTMERRVVPEDQNDYQLAEDLVGNMYAGYFAGTQSWEGGNNGTTYAFPSGWLNRPFKVAFVDFLSSWNVLRQKTNESTVLYAVAEVVKVLAMHKTTDIYGPIPYTRFGRVTPVPYDSQEEVYKAFFKELDHAIGIMTEYDAANPDTKPLEKFDLIYNGEISKWIKFANSLKLRLAMRVSKVYPEAQQIAEAAVNNKYGVIENNTDNPVMQSNSTCRSLISIPSTICIAKRDITKIAWELQWTLISTDSKIRACRYSLQKSKMENTAVCAMVSRTDLNSWATHVCRNRPSSNPIQLFG